MRCLWNRNDVIEAVLAYVIAGAAWLVAGALAMTRSQEFRVATSTKSPMPELHTTRHPPEEEVCCSGILGYASDNMSLNFPCQNRPCCNSSDTVAVVAIDFALGFMFQCMPRRSIQPLCYESGTEVRTTNQDPDFIPRTCCHGLKFKVVVNQWYAAMVVKCVELKDDDSSS